MPHAKRPSSSVILCAVPRSGSTLLCDLMSATGVCGTVQSYFRRLSINVWIKRFDLDIDRNDPDFASVYYAAALAAGSDGAGTFGLRMMWDNVPELSAWLDTLFPGLGNDRMRIAAAFGPPAFVIMTRRDMVAQAVSRLRAKQSGLWHVRADGSERERAAPHRDPVYDAAALAGHIAEAEHGEARWNDWFAANGIVPARIHYEDLAARPGETLTALLEAIGRDPVHAQGVAPISARMADAQSRDWAARYRREAGLPSVNSTEMKDPLA